MPNRFLGMAIAAHFLAAVCGPAAAQSTPETAMTAPLPRLAQSSAPGVQVSEPWARATAKTARTGVAYMTLENAGAVADKLVSASTPAAGRVGLHTHIKDGDVLRMREIQSIEIGPHAKVRLQPGGLHVMLVDLKGPLEQGSTFPLTLRFEKAGEVTVEVAVQAAGATGKGQGHGHGH